MLIVRRALLEEVSGIPPIFRLSHSRMGGRHSSPEDEHTVKRPISMRIFVVPQKEPFCSRAFWFTRPAAKACHTVSAKHPPDGHKNGAWQKPHWERGANPSKRGPLH